MATTFTSAKVAASVPAKETNQGIVQVTSTYALTAALVVNDVIQMVKVPKGARIVNLFLAVDDLDTATGIVLDVGDGADTDRFIDGSTIGQAGGIAQLGSGLTAATATAALGYVYTADDTIDVLVQVAPTTGAATGNVVLTVIYSSDA